MSSESYIQQLRRVFKIPDAVTIYTAPKLNILPATIGGQPTGSRYNIDQGVTPDPETQIMVYTTLDLTVPAYTDNLNRSIASYQLHLDTLLITVSQAKKIITTEIQGRDGTVKEYIGMDDYTVQVNGVIVAANGVNPASDVSNLKRVLDAPVAISASNAYLQNLGILSLVVFDYELGQEKGSYSYQSYAITFKSDVPQQLRITGV